MNGFTRTLSFGAFIALVGCAAPPPPPPPTILELTFTAGADINPDPNGRPSSVNIRYYQLGATGAFEKADYFQLHDKEAALLTKDLLDQQDLLLAPGASKTVTLEGKAGAKFLGVTGSFRDIDKATWRASTDIPPNKTTKMKVDVSKLTVTVAPAAGG